MIYRFLSKIPIFGPALAITNAYVFNGDFSSDSRFAPISMWMKLFPGIFLAAGLASITMFASCSGNNFPYCGQEKNSFIYTTESLSTTILPTILGFGIGVYALIFSLSTKFIRLFHEHAKKTRGTGKRISVLTINADMAYPLLAIVFSIAIGLFQQRFASKLWLSAFTWASLWYSLIMTIEIIGTIYRLGEHSLLDKLDENEDSNWS